MGGAHEDKEQLNHNYERNSAHIVWRGGVSWVSSERGWGGKNHFHYHILINKMQLNSQRPLTPLPWSHVLGPLSTGVAGVGQHWMLFAPGHLPTNVSTSAPASTQWNVSMFIHCPAQLLALPRSVWGWLACWCGPRYCCSNGTSGSSFAAKDDAAAAASTKSKRISNWEEWL